MNCYIAAMRLLQLRDSDTGAAKGLAKLSKAAMFWLGCCGGFA